jgi:hypothetical protein
MREIYLMSKTMRVDPAKAKVEVLFTAITNIDWETVRQQQGTRTGFLEILQF